MSNWILCSEKQPAKEGRYLISNCYGEVNTDDYVEGWNCFRMENGTINREFEAKPGFIIAWQPLPAPYKEGDDE